jgi:hypothetical protein
MPDIDLLFPFRASAEPLAAHSPGDDDAQEPPVRAFVGGFVHLKEEDEMALLVEIGPEGWTPTQQPLLSSLPPFARFHKATTTTCARRGNAKT